MIESSKAVGPWRERIAEIARAEYRGDPVTGPIRLSLSFVMPRPKSTPKRSTPPAVKRPDLDKLARAVGDALTKVVWADDSQIVRLDATKRIAEVGEPPGVYISVVELAVGIAAGTEPRFERAA